MAIETRRYMVDDLAAKDDPRSEVPADETIRFSVNGAEYEIDLSRVNAGAFRDRIRPYQEAARRVRAQPRGPRPAAQRQQTAKIRGWARENNIKVSNSGRLPAGLVARYEASGASSPQPDPVALPPEGVNPEPYPGGTRLDHPDAPGLGRNCYDRQEQLQRR
jgi:hypothetical protein